MRATEKPMLFSTPLVKEILAGRKTMTRRPVRPQPQHMLIRGRQERPGERCKWYDADCINPGVEVKPPCVVGDLLYVRETWRHVGETTDTVFKKAIYRADCRDGEFKVWRPSIHMPKWAARIWLSVTDVRVERVQDITASAAVAEGARFFDEGSLEPSCFGGRGPGWSMGDPKSFGETLGSARMAFANAWIALYGQEAWDANQWVWALTFERVDAPAREGGHA